MLWQLVLLLVLLGWLVIMRIKNRKLLEIAAKLKSDLPTLPIIGHVHHFMGDGEVRMSALQSMCRHGNENGGWSILWLGTSVYAICTDAIDLDYICKTHLEKDDILKITSNLVGNGLIFAPVSIWRPRRKVLAPTFSQHNLNQFVNIFYKQSCSMVENLKAKVNKGTFPTWKYFTSYTMDSICQTTLGENIGAQKTADHPFLRYFQIYADLTARRIFYPWLHNETSFKYLAYFGMYSTISECCKYLKGFVNDIIEKKRAALKARTTDHGEGFKPILELLIEASGGEKGYTNEELQEEAQVILTAGTDTSAVGSAFVAMMLAKYPDVQEKVYKEIHDFYGDSDRPIVAEDLKHLTYTENVIKETLRLYPPVPITVRKIVKDDVTPSGQKLTAGMAVIVSHWGVQRNQKYWGEDAEEFRPERFIDSPPTHPAAYMPFSAGPRNCLGYKYAMMSMMTATTMVVRHYRLLPSDNDDLKKPLRLKYDVMMKHIEDFQVKLEARK